MRENRVSSTGNQSWIVPAVELPVTQTHWVFLLPAAWACLSLAVPVTSRLALLNCYVSGRGVSGPQGKSDYSALRHSWSRLQRENAQGTAGCLGKKK